jgi:hypothetical protein
MAACRPWCDFRKRLYNDRRPGITTMTRALVMGAAP